jgi:hypothetical protein
VTRNVSTRLAALERAAGPQRKGVRVFGETATGAWMEWPAPYPDAPPLTTAEVAALAADGWQVVKVIHRDATEQNEETTWHSPKP